MYGAITQEVHWNANRYLMIVGLSIPALSVYESGVAIFRTMGNSKITMMLSAIMNVVNICGNALLIYVFKMGTAGAATATVVARYTAAVIMILLLLRTNHPLYLQRTLKYIPDGNKIKRILQIGVPNGIENGLFQVGKIILAGLFTHFGTSAITANAVCLTISGIQVIPGSAISLAATTVIARCVGAGDEKQVRFYNRLLLGISYVSMIVFCGVFWFGFPAILPLYHLSEQTAVLATKMILVHTLGAIGIWPLTFVLPSSMRAAGDVRFAMITSVASMFVFRLGGCIFVCINLWYGNSGNLVCHVM